MRCAAFDPLGVTRALDQSLAQCIDGFEISAHPFEHDLASDVDHVAVADAMMIDYRGHFPSGRQFTRLTLRGEDRDLGSGEIFQDDFRHKL